jgi:hypothetical protein
MPTSMFDQQNRLSTAINETVDVRLIKTNVYFKILTLPSTNACLTFDKFDSLSKYIPVVSFVS